MDVTQQQQQKRIKFKKENVPCLKKFCLKLKNDIIFIFIFWEKYFSQEKNLIILLYYE